MPMHVEAQIAHDDHAQLYPNRHFKKRKMGKAIELDTTRYQFRPIPQSPSQLVCRQQPPRGKCLDNERYSIVRVLGMGAHACVLHARDEQTSRPVAIKIPMDVACTGQEERMLRRIQESGVEHVVRCLRSFTWNHRTCLVFEKLQGTVFHAIQKSSRRGKLLPHALIRVWLAQLLRAVAGLHRLRVIHRDIKPENLLVDSTGHLQVSDFGSAADCAQAWDPYVQSRVYRAPEVLDGAPYTTAIDVWSVGCVACELRTGEPIFPGTSIEDQRARIACLVGSRATPRMSAARTQLLHTLAPPGQDQHAGQELSELVLRMLHPDPGQRATAHELLDHPYFTSPVGKRIAAARA